MCQSCWDDATDEDKDRIEKVKQSLKKAQEKKPKEEAIGRLKIAICFGNDECMEIEREGQAYVITYDDTKFRVPLKLLYHLDKQWELHEAAAIASGKRDLEQVVADIVTK